MANPGAFVTFFLEAVELKSESEKQGRPVFKDIPFIRKIVPGDSTNIVERKATDQDKQDYPREWAGFERTNAVGMEGTPLEQWPQVTRAQVKEAKYFEVHTVEQMSQLSDAHCQKLGMGFHELRAKAKAYLVAAAGTAGETAQAAENERLRSLIADLQAQVSAVSEVKRGRPKKETEDV